MLWTASEIKGYAIAASDGEVGGVSDLLFDDANWQIRWLVVETGNWLSGRKVLLPVSTLGHANADRREFSAKLTKKQVKDSPDIDTERPVSRQMETNVYSYYGWRPYWSTSVFTGGRGYMGGYGYGASSIAALATPESRRYEQEQLDAERTADHHLRSIEAVSGYHIHATDGEIGHVADMLVEEADWSIHYMVVDTRNWWPGKRVLISPRLAQEVSWADRSIHINVDRQAVKDSPAYDPTMTVDRTYEEQFHSYYGNLEAGAPVQARAAHI